MHRILWEPVPENDSQVAYFKAFPEGRPDLFEKGRSVDEAVGRVALLHGRDQSDLDVLSVLDRKPQKVKGSRAPK